MARTVQNTTYEQIMASEMTGVFLILLDIVSDDLIPILGVNTIRVVNNNEDIVSGGNTYTATAFDFTPPAEEESEAGTASLTIDNVDRSIVTAIRSIGSPANVTAKVILAATPDVTEAGPFEFQLRDVSYNVQQVTGTLHYQTFMRDIMGKIRYNSENFPGLVQ